MPYLGGARVWMPYLGLARTVCIHRLCPFLPNVLCVHQIYSMYGSGQPYSYQVCRAERQSDSPQFILTQLFQISCITQAHLCNLMLEQLSVR